MITLTAGWRHAALLALAAAAPVAAQDRSDTAQVESTVLGQWIDDYGNTFDIGPSTWHQKPMAPYRVESWNRDARFLIARRDPTPADPRTLWLRIDWMTFDGMKPWSWGFCLTAWEALSRAEAEQAKPADRSKPRTGCGGYPFSRMRAPGELR